ncbi:MAG: DUF6055 domain-containing protein [Deferrisomatales bacterium]|nr:DUF6055 domain-containing protein [Deferrisomatales bacterium]
MSRFPLGVPLALCAVLLALAGPAGAERCATGRLSTTVPRLAVRPLPRGWVHRIPAPVTTTGAHEQRTEHFRVFWGDGYDPADPDWQPDAAGVPLWVATLAQSLEAALANQTALGFPSPYGVDTYYLDAYVANTGVVVDGTPVTLGTSTYAFTDIDADTVSAFFVFNDDFSPYTADELGVLRATAAHELFHAVQRVEYPWDDVLLVPDARWRQEWWWFEATATWMEEVCHPEVDDYVTYVQTFLASPEEPLTSVDGLRPYGAAIFPGYLWLRHGGPATWRETFQTAYAYGLEAALDGALRARGSPPLADTVAAFWALAAHPDTTWPDGPEYRSGVSPWSALPVPSLPFAASATAATAPGRWGAHWFSLAAADLPLSLDLPSAQVGSAWRAALAVPDGGPDAAVGTLPAGGGITLGTRLPSGTAQLALVNVSAAEGSATYSLRVSQATPVTGPVIAEPVADPAEDPAENPLPAEDPPPAPEEALLVPEGGAEGVTPPEAGAGSGGCFLSVLSATERLR